MVTVMAIAALIWLSSGFIVGWLYYREKMKDGRENGWGNVNGWLGVWVGACFGWLLMTFMGPVAVVLWLLP